MKLFVFCTRGMLFNVANHLLCKVPSERSLARHGSLYDAIRAYTVIQGPLPIKASWRHTPTKPVIDLKLIKTILLCTIYYSCIIVYCMI